MSEIAERIHALREPEAAPEAPAPEAPAPESETPETPDVQDAQESKGPERQGQDTEVQPAEEGQEETLELETLDDLAAHFNLEPSDLYALQIPVTKEDGSQGRVSLGEWKDSYQESQAYQRAAREAKQQREAYQARQQEMEAQWEKQITDAAATLSVAESQLTQEFNDVNWTQLREDDPAEWAARRQLFNERNAAIQKAKGDLAETWQGAKAEQAKEAEQQRAEALEREQQALLKAIPEWADEDARQAERRSLADYLGASGFSPDEVNSVADHRLVVMARKAMLYDQNVSKADAAKKRVVRIGKRTVAPGTARAKQTAQEDAAAKLKQNLRKSGSLEDFAAVIRSRRGE